MPAMLASPRLRAIYLAAWLPVAGILVAILRFTQGMPWAPALILAVPATAALAFVCVAAGYPARALPPESNPLGRLLGVHLSGAVVTVALWLAALRLWVEIAGVAPELEVMRSSFPRLVPILAGFGLILYLMEVTLHYLLLANERRRAAERRTLELELLARQAELKLLRAQIDPHFLFNSLNSIAGLTHADPDGARAVCLRLGGFLRAGLKLGSRERVRLEEELALARDFLSVEQARFGPRLRVTERIEEPVLGCLVPPLILQPLLENAVRHGIAGLVEGGEVRLEARFAGANLCILVENPRDPEAAADRGEGLGLANVRRRLEAIYRGEAGVSVRESADRWRVELTIPVQAAVLEAAPAPRLETGQPDVEART
jgi:sensor histidine kinase YesM